MIRNVFSAVLLFFLFSYDGLAQTAKKDFISFGTSVVFVKSQLYKTANGETASSEPFNFSTFAGNAGYGRHLSKYLSLYVSLRYLGFELKKGFNFVFPGDNEQKIKIGYDTPLSIKDYKLIFSIESNPGFLSFLYFKLGGGMGLNTFNYINHPYPNKTIYGLDGDYLRVEKAAPLDTKNYYFSWYGGFGIYLVKSNLDIKMGLNSIHNQRVDMKYENLKIQNLGVEFYIQLQYNL